MPNQLIKVEINGKQYQQALENIKSSKLDQSKLLNK